MPDAQQTADRQTITAIDEQGELYPIGKLEAHLRNVPHLAVSVFLFHEGRLLMQQRAEGKYHSGGLWANTCCSHPLWQESLADCAERRLMEEVGCQINLTGFGTIEYQAVVGDMFENETAHCFVGYMPDPGLPIGFNTDEVSALRWQTLEQLRTDLRLCPDEYSPWLRIYMKEHFELIANVVYPANTVASAPGSIGEKGNTQRVCQS